jgi:hypothetical protein
MQSNQREKQMKIKFVNSDEFGVVPGAGWVLTENGKRIDWPMLTTREEAMTDLAGFVIEFRLLVSDETSERLGLYYMNGN